MSISGFLKGILNLQKKVDLKLLPSQGLFYKDDFHMNGGYVSDLSNLILDNPQIKYWLHGHTHQQVDYMVGETRVMCNARGYAGYEESGFDVNFTFEV